MITPITEAHPSSDQATDKVRERPRFGLVPANLATPEILVGRLRDYLCRHAQTRDWTIYASDAMAGNLYDTALACAAAAAIA